MGQSRTPADPARLGAPLGVRALARLVADCKRAGRITGNLIVLEPKCHPSAPVIASYWADAGAVVLECAECRAPVCSIAVAG